MKRIFIIGSALIVVGVLAAVGIGQVAGSKAQEQYLRSVEELNRQSFNLKLENTLYERGIFSSRARTLLTVTDGNIVLEHRISHGPLPQLRVETRFSREAGDNALLADIGMDALLDTPMVTEVNAVGDSVTSYSLPAFVREIDGHPEGAKVNLSMDGADFTLNLSSDLQEVSGTFSFPLLRIEGQEELFEIRDIVSTFSSSQEQGLPIGTSTFSLGAARFRIDTPEKYASFGLQGISLESDNQIAGDAYTARLLVKGREMTVSDESYGPFDIRLGMDGLPTAPLKRLQGEVEAFNAAGLSGGQEAQEAQVRFYMAMMEIVPELLQAAPRIVLERASFEGRGGKLQASGLATVDGEIDSPALDQLLGKLVANLDLSASRELVQNLIVSFQYLGAGLKAGADSQVDEMMKTSAAGTIDQLKAGKILVQEDADLKMNLHFEQLQATMNGEPLSM